VHAHDAEVPEDRREEVARRGSRPKGGTEAGAT
jgi:hypothetical protein